MQTWGYNTQCRKVKTMRTMPLYLLWSECFEETFDNGEKTNKGSTWIVLKKIPVNKFFLRKSLEYEYENYSVSKNHPNTNMNIIRFEKITRIQIQTLVFGLNYSNSIQIPKFKYQIFAHLWSRQSRNCTGNPETVQTIQKLSTQSRNCSDNPETVRTIQKLSW